MAVKTTVNDKGFQKSLKDIVITKSELLAVEGAGARNIATAQKTLVPVDTGATRASIGSHIVSVSEERIVDEVGAETEYAPFVELGTSNTNYPMQPFVRPSVFGREKSIFADMADAFFMTVLRRWKGKVQR